MGYRDYPSRRSTSHHRSRRDDNGRDARDRTRSRDAPRYTERRSRSRSRDAPRRTERRSPTPPRRTRRRSPSRSPSGDAYRRNKRRSPTPPRRTRRRSPSRSRSRDAPRRTERRSPTPPRHTRRRSHSRDARRSRSRDARRSSRDRRSDHHGSAADDSTTRLRFSNDKLDEIIAGMSRQTFDPQEESFGRFEATHIAAKIRGQTGTSFVPINPNGTAYLVPASTPHTAPDNSRWAARSVQNQTILTHCTGKHNTITVPASVDEAGDPVDNSGRNAVPGRPGTGGSNYPNLPPAGQVPNKQKPPMRPVAVPNGGRAPTSYAASAAQNADSSAQNADSSAQNADSSAQMDQGPTDLVERVEWLIKTTQTAEGPRPVPASFGQGWPTEGQVFGKKMGLNEQCRPGLCMSVFGYRGTPCPRGANCRSQHTWLKDDECRAIIANPLPENGGSKAGIAFLRVAVQHFVANQRLGLVDENHEVPMPPRPGRFYTLPQYQSWLASRKQRSQQRTFEQGQQTDNAGEHADHEEVESIIDSSHNTGQEPVPTPGLGASQHATASNNGHRTATNDRQGRPNTSRNGIRNPRVTGHPAANSRVFNPNASHINTDNLAYFNHTPAMGPWGGDIQSTVRQDDIAHNIEATAAEAAFIASGAPRGSFSVRYTDDAGQQATEQIDMANWKKPTVDDF